MKLLVKAIAAVVAVPVAASGAGLGLFLLWYPRVGPAPDILIGATPQRVERGRYVATHVAACFACHSTRDWTAFAGPVVPDTEGRGGERFGRDLGFPGTFFATNITPAALGDWTDGEILRAITSGVSRDGRALFPVMPYLSYRNLLEEDAENIIAYIRTLEQVPNIVPISRPDFSMSLIVRTMPQSYEPRQTLEPGASGEYLVTIAGCATCHTPTDRGGPIRGMNYAGGTEFPLARAGIVRSANITPDPDTGIGTWDADFFVRRFRQAASVDGRPIRVAAGEFNTYMPWTAYAGMTDDDLRAIYAYLRDLRPVKNSVNKFSEANKLPAVK